MQLQATELKQGSRFSSQCAGDTSCSCESCISWYAASTFHSSTVAGSLPGLKRKQTHRNQAKQGRLAEVQLQVHHELHRQACSLKGGTRKPPYSPIFAVVPSLPELRTAPKMTKSVSNGSQVYRSLVSPILPTSSSPTSLERL